MSISETIVSSGRVLAPDIATDSALQLLLVSITRFSRLYLLSGAGGGDAALACIPRSCFERNTGDWGFWEEEVVVVPLEVLVGPLFWRGATGPTSA